MPAVLDRPSGRGHAPDVSPAPAHPARCVRHGAGAGWWTVRVRGPSAFPAGSVSGPCRCPPAPPCAESTRVARPGPRRACHLGIAPCRNRLGQPPGGSVPMTHTSRRGGWPGPVRQPSGARSRRRSRDGSSLRPDPRGPAPGTAHARRLPRTPQARHDGVHRRMSRPEGGAVADPPRRSGAADDRTGLPVPDGPPDTRSGGRRAGIPPHHCGAHSSGPVRPGSDGDPRRAASFGTRTPWAVSAAGTAAVVRRQHSGCRSGPGGSVPLGSRSSSHERDQHEGRRLEPSSRSPP